MNVAPAKPAQRWLRWLHEPLLHFLVIGLLLFAVDHLTHPAVDDRVIVVDEGVREMLVDKFKQGRGRSPTPTEYERLVKLWSADEAMYREALLLGLDQGDESIRARMILNLRYRLLNNSFIGEPVAGELEAWLEVYRDRFDLPLRFDFELAQLPDGDDPQAALTAARARGELPETYGERLGRYGNRSRADIAKLFGGDFADALVAAVPEQWVVLGSDTGRHLARITRVYDPIPTMIADQPVRVETAWREAQAKLSVIRQVRELQRRYEVRREDQQ